MPNGPDQRELVSFLVTMEHSLAYAAKAQAKYLAEQVVAGSVRPMTIASELDRSQAWHMRCVYESHIALMQQTIADFRELFGSYLPPVEVDEVSQLDPVTAGQIEITEVGNEHRIAA